MGWKHYFRHNPAQARAQNTAASPADAYAYRMQQQRPVQHNRAPPNERDKKAAEELKTEGNACFAKAKYGAAIEVPLFRLHLLMTVKEGNVLGLQHLDICPDAMQKYTEALTIWPGLTGILSAFQPHQLPVKSTRLTKRSNSSRMYKFIQAWNAVQSCWSIEHCVTRNGKHGILHCETARQL